MLRNLVNELEGRPKRSSGGGRKKKSGGTKAKKFKPKGRSGVQRDPSIRGDVGLSLTRSQFTATSPLNNFQPVLASTPGGTRVKARELVGSLSLSAASTGAFTPLTVNSVLAAGQQVPMNPRYFARLQSFAPIYEQFVFHKLNINFISNQPTTATGELLMAVDYDAKDSPPASSVALMRNLTSTMGNVYSDASMQALKSLSRLPRYFCSEDNTTDSNQILQGIVYPVVEGYTGAINAVVGYLVMEYDVEFFTPC